MSRAPSTPICFRLSKELADRLDAKAGGNRSAYLQALVEADLNGSVPQGAAPVSERGLVGEARVAAFRRAEALRRAGN